MQSPLELVLGHGELKVFILPLFLPERVLMLIVPDNNAKEGRQ